MERKQDERDRQHVYLLRRAGYTRLEQLSGVSYEHVHRALRETNEREKISGDLPSQETINLWILQGGRGEKGTIRGISGRGALLSMDSLAGPEDTTMRLDPDLFPTDQDYIDTDGAEKDQKLDEKKDGKDVPPEEPAPCA